MTLTIVEGLKGEGCTQSDIARMYGVTRQYVSWIKYTHGDCSPRAKGEAGVPVVGAGTDDAAVAVLPHAGPVGFGRRCVGPELGRCGLTSIFRAGDAPA